MSDRHWAFWLVIALIVGGLLVVLTVMDGPSDEDLTRTSPDLMEHHHG